MSCSRRWRKLEKRFGALAERRRRAPQAPGRQWRGRRERRPRQCARAAPCARAACNVRANSLPARQPQDRARRCAEGLGRAYRKARKAFRDAYRERQRRGLPRLAQGGAAALAPHAAAVARLAGGAVDARASEAKELSRLLGDDHDLAVLTAFAQARVGRAFTAEDFAALVDLGRACQAELRALAKPRATRLFAEPADELKERVSLYWASAQRLSALAPPKEQEAPVKPKPNPSPPAPNGPRAPPRRIAVARYPLTSPPSAWCRTRRIAAWST